MTIGKNFGWRIVPFAWSSRKAEDGGFISFGNQELRENILNCSRYWANSLISSESATEWTYRLRFEISVVIIFVSLVPKRRHISHKFFHISFVHCTPNQVLMQQVSRQTVDSNAAGVWPDCRLEFSRCLGQTVGSCWETTLQSDWVQCSHWSKQCNSPFLLRICWKTTCQADRVQCNRCLKQYSSPFLLPYLESAHTVYVVSVLAPVSVTALDRAATGIGYLLVNTREKYSQNICFPQQPKYSSQIRWPSILNYELVAVV
jgi:hypothetical protein